MPLVRWRLSLLGPVPNLVKVPACMPRRQVDIEVAIDQIDAPGYATWKQGFYEQRRPPSVPVQARQVRLPPGAPATSLNTREC